jgi:hypothetical protein
MPVLAPQPEQPSPVEIAQWNTGRSNARQQYEASLAQTNYGKAQATLGNDIAMRQQQFNQGQQRRTFDDPYISRGLFNSGIRQRGLSDFYTQQANQQATQQQQYMGQMGQFDLNDLLAMQARDAYLGNVDAQEQARRAQLAAEIKGIV